MKRVFFLAALASACSGAVGVPGSCGFWEEASVASPEQGECLWVAVTTNGAVRADDSCPDDSDRCAVVAGDDVAHLWIELGVPSQILTLHYEFGEDGSCPVSCGWDGPCAQIGDICVPCPPGYTYIDAPEGRFECPEAE